MSTARVSSEMTLLPFVYSTVLSGAAHTVKEWHTPNILRCRANVGLSFLLTLTDSHSCLLFISGKRLM